MKITDGQRFALNKLISKYAKDRAERLYIIGKLINKQVESTSELEVTDWRIIRNSAYKHWSDNNWDVDEDFSKICYKLHDEYETEIVGQLKLW